MKNVLANGLAKLKKMYYEYKDVSIDKNVTLKSLPDDLPRELQNHNKDMQMQNMLSSSTSQEEIEPDMASNFIIQWGNYVALHQHKKSNLLAFSP